MFSGCWAYVDVAPFKSDSVTESWTLRSLVPQSRPHSPEASSCPGAAAPRGRRAFPSSRLHFGHHAHRVWSTMVAPLFLAVVAALWWHPVSGRLAQSTATIPDFVCSQNARYYNVTAEYRIWRSALVRVASSVFTGQCVVSVILRTSSEPLQPRRPPLLLFIKIERLRLRKLADSFFVIAPRGRTDNYRIATYCCPTYIWASESVQLYLYVKKTIDLNVSYDAAFVVTEATNMCLANGTGELLLRSGDSGEYVFAPDHRYKDVPPNNVACTSGVEYYLMLRSSASSALLNVTALACPHNNSCDSLKLNDLNCTNGMTVIPAPPDSSVTLRYVLKSSCNDAHKPTGFVVSAQVVAPAETPSTLIVVTASVAAVLTAALAIAITIALLRRRRLLRRQRSLDRKSSSSAVQRARSSASAGDEEIAMVGNDLYGIKLASRTMGDQ